MQRFKNHLKHLIRRHSKDLSNHLTERFQSNCLLLFCALIAFQVAGCRTVAYYHQAALGQWQIERNKNPIQQLKKDPETNPELKEKFETIQDIRRFAFWNLNLPAEDAYDTYVALDRDYVVWNVTACPEFSMEPHRWWYPFLGKLKYRGYFDEAEAHQYAQTLETKGHDVAVEGVVAYSTLGWFRDPVFNTFMDWPDRAIAELLFHELSHRKVFLTGKTEWNEAFAVVTARAGVREWLTSKSLWDELETYETEIELEETFIELVLETKQELEQLYASFDSNDSDNPNSSSAIMSITGKSAQKQSIYDAFRDRFENAKVQNPSLEVYEGWMARPLNNARLSAIDTYYQWVPMFQKLQKRYTGDWSRFFDAVERLDNEQSLEDS